MAVGMEEESERKGGIALYFPANDDEASSSSSSSPPKLPRRLRRRLMESKTPSTNEAIQAKLRQADLRRQAKRQRAGYVMQRKRCDIVGANMKGVPEQEYVTAKIARCWRKFRQVRKTTFALAKAFQALGITEDSVKSIEFDQLALQISETATIQTAKALLARLESRYTILREISGNVLSMVNIDHLLKHIGLHGRSRQVTKTSRSDTIGSKKAAKGPIKVSRYPTKVVLFAYMILGHTDTVFMGKSECENALLDSALSFIREFELLIKIIVEGPLRSHQEGPLRSHQEGPLMPLSFKSQLETFDNRWCSYLYHFVVWKNKDAVFFEANMMGAARQLEQFMMQTSKLSLEGDNITIAHDMQACEKQKIPTHKLQQFESSKYPVSVTGLSSSKLDTDTVYLPGSRQAESSKSGLHGSPDDSLVSLSAEMNNLAGGSRRNFSSEKNECSTSTRNVAEEHIKSSDMLVTENELVANEIVHEHHQFLSVTSNDHSEAQDSLKVKVEVREIMEKAFWDGILDSMKQDEPDFSWVMKVVKEVRDELCEMSPLSWRSEIAEKIDLELLSQVLNSGTMDVDYFRKLLEFTLVTLQKLSAPAKEKEMETSYQKLMEELGEVSCSGEKSKASFALLVVKGLRFILHQIQNLKKEITNAHIMMVEPLIKSPAGLDYLKSSFSKRCGSPSEAPASLPLTRQWLSSVWVIAEQEWKEHTDSVAVIINNTRVHQGIPPSTLRTGGNTQVSLKNSPTSLGTAFHGKSGKEQPGFKGERLDLLIRLGLLKLVNQVRGLTNDTLPETLKLNLTRLRIVQSQLQRIIVISTSLLVVRQILHDESSVSNPSEVQNFLSTCVKHLCELLDTIDNAGIPEIVEALHRLLGDHDMNPEKLQARKHVMANMLIKSLQEGDVIYEQVSRNVYLAARGVVLGGSGTEGRQLAEAALRHIGAGALTDMVVEAAEVLVVVAVVSVIVHGDWYRELMKNW